MTQGHDNVALSSLGGLSICAGIGGIDLGLRRALGKRYVTECYIEKEVTAAGILAARIEDGQLCSAPIWSDLHTFDAEPWVGRIDIITAGIPCQPWSVAGRQRGATDERHLWTPTCRIIDTLKPTFFLLENVPGILSGGGIEPIYADLQAMGYRIEGGFFTAASLGAPHIRKRFFLLAYADGVTIRHAAQQSGNRTGENTLQLVNDGAAQQMADAARIRRRPERTEGCNLEDEDSRSHKRGRACDSAQPQSCSSEVADADRVRELQQFEVWTSERGRLAYSSDAVADTLCKGLEVSERSPERQEEVMRTPRQSGALSQSDSSRRHANAGEPESLLGGIVDGLPACMDDNQWSADWEANCPRVIEKCDDRAARLACLGNAVVPAVASHAFAFLARRIYQKEKKENLYA